MQRKRIVIMLLFICLIIIFTSGCSNKDDITNKYKDSFSDVTSNILGLMERQGDYIYYVSEKNGNKIYRMKINGTNKKKLTNDASEIIGVKDECVYYIRYGSKGKIYKVDTDGKKNSLLTNDFTRYPKIYGDWIYYISEDDYNLYKINLDGMQKKRLNSDIIRNYIIEGDWVFYNNLSDGHKLYKIKTDGTSSFILVDDSVSEFTIYNDIICYVNHSDEDKIYKVNTDGSGRAPLMDYSDTLIFKKYKGAYHLEIESDYLYYVNGYSLSRVKLDGTNWEELFATNSSEFTIDNKWVYAYVDYRNSVLTRYKIN